MKYSLLLVLLSNIVFSQYHEFNIQQETIAIELDEEHGKIVAYIETQVTIKTNNKNNHDHYTIIIDSPFYAQVSDLSCRIGDTELKDSEISFSHYQNRDIFFSDYKFLHFDIPLTEKKKSKIYYEYSQEIKDITYLPPIRIPGAKKNHLTIIIESIPGISVNFKLEKYKKEINPIIQVDDDEYRYILNDVSGIEPPSYAYDSSSPGRILIQLKRNQKSIIPETPVMISNWYYRNLQKKSLHQTTENIDMTPYQHLKELPDIDLLDSLYEFVTREIRYKGDLRKRHFFLPSPASKVFMNKFGDCKDKSNLLIALADSFQIPLYPALVKADSIFPYNMLSLYNYDHMLCAYPRGNGQWLFIDPTAEGFPLGNVPQSIVNRQALILNPDAPSLSNIFTKDSSNITLHTLVNPDKLDSTAIQIIATGDDYARIKTAIKIKNSIDRQNRLGLILNRQFYRLGLYDLQYDFDHNHKIGLNGKADLSKLVIKGSKKFYLPGQFFNIKTNSLITKTDNLPSIYWPNEVSYDLIIELNQNYLFNNPKPVLLSDSEFTYIIKIDEKNYNRLHAQLRIPQKKYDNEMIDRLIDFIRKVNGNKKVLFEIERNKL